MKREYNKPTAELVTFDFTAQVVASQCKSGGDFSQYIGNPCTSHPDDIWSISTPVHQ